MGSRHTTDANNRTPSFTDFPRRGHSIGRRENRLSGCTSGLSWLLRLAKREKNGLLMFL
jgi:hypothetical protein